MTVSIALTARSSLPSIFTDSTPEVPTTVSTMETETDRKRLRQAAEVKRILQMPENVTKLTDIGAVPSPMTPDQFTAFIAAVVLFGVGSGPVVHADNYGPRGGQIGRIP